MTILDVASLPRSPAAPPCSEARLRRAGRRIQLPLHLKGAGILSLADRHAAAFTSSLICSALQDSTLQEHLVPGMSRHAVHAHAQLCSLVGPRSARTEGIEELLHRDDPLAMLNFSLFQEIFERRAAENLPPLKLQREFSRTIARRRADDLLAEESDIGTAHVHGQDFVAAHVQGNPAQPLRARLSEFYNRVQANWFVAWFRRFLRLPQLQRLGNAEPRAGHDAYLELCLGSHSTGHHRLLDIWGTHDNGDCPPCAKGRAIGHTRHTYGTGSQSHRRV